MSPVPGRTLTALACLAALVAGGCSPTPAPAPSSPPSARGASSSSPGSLRVVGLGDSVMESAQCGCDGPAEVYARQLGTRLHRPVSADNLGISGATAHALASDLADDDDTRRAVAGADVVVVIVGANDVAPLVDDWEHCPSSCWSDDLDQLDGDLDAVLASIDEQRRDARVPVLVTTYWDVLEDGKTALARYGQPRQDWTMQLTGATNQVIARQAARHGDTLVDLDAVFHGADGRRDATGLLLDDADHPNQQGVDAIARALVAATPTGLGGR